MEMNVEAVSAFEKAISVEPGNIDNRYQLAELYYIEGNKDESRKHIEAILEIEPDNQRALKALETLDE